MKKSLVVLYSSAAFIFVVAFGLMSLTNNEEGREFLSEYDSVDFLESDAGGDYSFTDEEVWDHFQDEMSPELSRFVSYDEGEIFSRCPSGLSQEFDYEESHNEFAIGEVTVWEGCVDQHYCYYKVNMESKTTFLKMNEEDEYMAMADFVEMEEERTMAKF